MPYILILQDNKNQQCVRILASNHIQSPTWVNTLLNELRPHYRALFVSLHIFARCSARGIFCSKMSIWLFLNVAIQLLVLLSTLESAQSLGLQFYTQAASPQNVNKRTTYSRSYFVWRLWLNTPHSGFRRKQVTFKCHTCLRGTYLDIRTTNIKKYP